MLPAADIIIVGAGPAGLAAAQACTDLACKFEVIELGALVEHRDHNHAADLGHGVGGAGLYSDGKFSFFPSATSLWELQPRSDLVRSYQWLGQALAQERIKIPEYPEGSEQLSKRQRDGRFYEKSYPSFYLPLDARAKLIASLQARILPNLRVETMATSLAKSDQGWRIELENPRDGARRTVEAQCVILATGRFGPLLTQNSFGLQQNFRRLEIGVRIEQPSNVFFLADQNRLDPKFILSDSAKDVEWRTFCCCRQGEVVAIRHGDILSVSGRSDVLQTGLSNVGFHIRITNEDRAAKIWPGLLQRIRATASPATMLLCDLLGSQNPDQTHVGMILGPELTAELLAGLSKLMEEFGKGAFAGAVLHAPALEHAYPFSSGCW